MPTLFSAKASRRDATINRFLSKNQLPLNTELHPHKVLRTYDLEPKS